MQCARLSLRQVHRCRFRPVCRPSRSRQFHTSQSLRIPSGTPHAVPNPSASDNVSKDTAEPNGELENKDFVESRSAESTLEQARSRPKRDGSPYGSAVRRHMRNRKQGTRSARTVVIPAWFRERNIVLSDQPAEVLQQAPHTVGIGRHQQAETETSKQDVSHGGDAGDGVPGKDPGNSAPEHRYLISEEIWNEIRAAIQAGMTIPASRYADDPSVRKVHLVLQYPGEGGILFLDAVVKKAASSFGTHVITLNAQDIAELYNEQEQEEGAPLSPMASLGYEVYLPNKKVLQREAEEEAEEAYEAEEEEEIESESRSTTIPILPVSDPTTLGSNILQGLFGGRASLGVAKVSVIPNRREGSAGEEETDSQSLRVINKILSIPKSGVATAVGEPAETQKSDSSKAGEKYEDLVVQIQDYKDLLVTPGGSTFLSSLHAAVQARRRKGQKIIVVGTVSNSEPEKSPAKAFPKLIPMDYDRFSTTIFVTPAMESGIAETTFTEDSKRRTLEINIRHLQNMLKKRINKPIPPESSIFSNRTWPLETSLIRACGLDAGYWPFDLVHRIATLTLGSSEPQGDLELQHIQQAIQVFEKSDRVKCEWFGHRETKAKPGKETQDKPRFNKSKLKCNSHEEKLLNGVVDSQSIRTTFADVHVPQETVEALKTLTSLSLVRPDAFTYGVLSTDKIPGLLLYGPPGTGKTLLAKAVARESGATVLEVSGSEVYDMYVGEGEKNVKAIFTLAKKLSPCVVFIDEADAIFCSRTGASNRTSHRELINQFLREWDGMSETSAFIMVATNRPFDLDDAVLRRLPRRLLVDLPTEQDRHEILKIHLKGEVLDESINLADLARRTPFYSGSDLKNMSVAAALACVREEYDAATSHSGEEPYQYPERRTLRPHHFHRAMEEISASISEDMSSLTAIRKFDEKYGDRKGRRKKSLGLGFIAAGEHESSPDAGRVRQ